MPNDLFEELPHQKILISLSCSVAVPSFIGIPCFQVFVAAVRKTRRVVREEKQFSAHDAFVAAGKPQTVKLGGIHIVHSQEIRVTQNSPNVFFSGNMDRNAI